MNKFIRQSVKHLLFVILLSSCRQDKLDSEICTSGQELKLGMNLPEVKRLLEDNEIDLHFMFRHGRHVAVDKEFLAETSHQYTFFIYRLEFDNNNQLIRANLDINESNIKLGEPITLDLSVMDEEAEQAAPRNR